MVGSQKNNFYERGKVFVKLRAAVFNSGFMIAAAEQKVGARQF